jgi:hypothetical protein
MNQVGVINATATGITPTGSGIPKEYKLEQNYPNPFNPTTNIKFDIPMSGNIRIVIFDVIGNELQPILDNVLQAGSYSIQFNATNLSSGLYLYKLISSDYSETKKMMLIK